MRRLILWINAIVCYILAATCFVIVIQHIEEFSMSMDWTKHIIPLLCMPAFFYLSDNASHRMKKAEKHWPDKKCECLTCQKYG